MSSTDLLERARWWKTHASGGPLPSAQALGYARTEARYAEQRARFGDWTHEDGPYGSFARADLLDAPDGLTVRLLIGHDDQPVDWGDIEPTDAERDAAEAFYVAAVVLGPNGAELFHDGIGGVDAIDLPGYMQRDWEDAARYAWTEYLMTEVDGFLSTPRTPAADGYRDGLENVAADPGRWNDGGEQLAAYHRGYVAGEHERNGTPAIVRRALDGLNAVRAGDPDYSEVDDEHETHAADAVTNVMHYLDSLGLDPANALETARGNFDDERSDLLTAVTDGFVRALLWADAMPLCEACEAFRNSASYPDGDGCPEHGADGPQSGGLENSDPTPDLRRKGWEFCARFLAAASTEDIDAHMEAFGDPDGGHPGEFIGHTFYLDAAGHGVSFTDRAWKDDDPMTAVCERLRDVAKTFSEVEHLMAYELADGRVGL